jgi:hypothetical protein
MRLWGLVFLGAGLFAADPPPQSAPVLGVLLERDAQPASGQFSIRLDTNEVLRYRFDAGTAVERNLQSIDVPRLKPGEKLEIVSDPLPGLVLRYARTVRVIAEPPPVPGPRPQRPASLLSRTRSAAADRMAEDRMLPVGNITYAGVVSRMTGDRLVLHTRDGREQSVLLRRDTRYLLNGDLVDPATLKLNTPVFVRAGKDLWDQVEAYQVIWGQILSP